MVRDWIRHRRPMVVAIIGFAAGAVLAASGPIKTCVRPGDAAPEFTLSAVRGGSFQLRTATPQPALIAFLQATPDSADTPSRGEVALLQSMDHQYRSRGLRVVVIDATEVAAGHKADHNSLINASYDWNLQIPLLDDDAGRVAHMFGITHVPTTILVKADGHVAQVWERRIVPGELAIAIETALGGGPLAPDSSSQGVK
jgi:peroxiredoxin